MMQLSQALVGRGLGEGEFVDAAGTRRVPSLPFLAVVAIPHSNATVIDAFHASSGREGFDLEFPVVERHKGPLLAQIAVRGQYKQRRPCIVRIEGHSSICHSPENRGNCASCKTARIRRASLATCSLVPNTVECERNCTGTSQRLSLAQCY
jgi:hypothetical protein